MAPCLCLYLYARYAVRLSIYLRLRYAVIKMTKAPAGARLQGKVAIVTGIP
jgi:hypothetical protein